jgi:hypothetical protein
MNNMTRTGFVKIIIGGLLTAFLAFLALFLGPRTVSGATCSNCPGKGICNGESDCNTYLK